MDDPVLALKCFCLCITMIIATDILRRFAAGFRESPFIIPPTEACAIVIEVLSIAGACLCLIWATIAWIAK